jgi:hypothetical protein
MSHNLTDDQIQDAQKVFNIEEFFTLSQVNPELYRAFSQVPASCELEQVIDLAEALAIEAVNAKATHFYCVGQPSLAFWANLIASGQALKINGYAQRNSGISSNMICIESTTERLSEEIKQPDGSVLKTSSFRHVRWRKVFL